MKDKNFKFYVPLDLIKADGEDEWRIRGIASTEDPDLQGEVVKQNGLDISLLKQGRGLFNADHQKGPENILGKIDDAEITSKGLMVEGYLFKHQPRAQAFYNILKSLKEGDSHRVQMSIEGRIQKRTGKDQKVIAKAKVEKIALTVDPVNGNTYAELAKSLFIDSDTDSSDHSRGAEIRDSSSTLVSDTTIEEDNVALRKAEEKELKLTQNELSEYFKIELKNFLKSWFRTGISDKHLEGDELRNFVSEHVHEGIINRSVWEKKFLEAKRAYDYDEDCLDEIVDGIDIDAMKQDIEECKNEYNAMQPVMECAMALSRKADEVMTDALMKAKDRTKKALAMSPANYANTLPGNMSNGVALTKESLASKKRKEALKGILKSLHSQFPDVDIDVLAEHAITILKKQLSTKE